MNENFSNKFLDCADLGGGGTHRISFYDWGNQQSNKIVFCVHGLTRNAHDFDYLAKRLATKGYRVICAEMAGRGKSEWLKNPELYTYPQYVSDMLTLIGSLGITPHPSLFKMGRNLFTAFKFEVKSKDIISFFSQRIKAVLHKGQSMQKEVYWVGTSMGGLIGMMIASSFPDLFKKMVMNDIGPFIPKEALMRIGEYVGKNMSFKDKNSAEIYLKKLMEPFGVGKEEYWQHIFTHNFYEKENELYLAYDPAIGNAFWNNRGTQRVMQDIDLWNLWKMIKCPVLILRGANSDLLLKDTAVEMAKRPDTELVEIPNTGHAPMLMEDAQIKLISDWFN